MTRSGFTTRIDGVFVPMFTPFTPDASAVDEDQLRRHVQFLLEAGIKLLNPVGTTGEFWTLSPEEHRLVIRTVCEEVTQSGFDAMVIPGTTSHHLKEALDLAEFAIECGAKMIQLAPPYYLPSLRPTLLRTTGNSRNESTRLSWFTRFHRPPACSSPAH